MVGEEALSGLADLKLLPGGVPSRRLMRCSVPAVGGRRHLLHLLRVQFGLSWGGVGHAQVGADDVDDGLTVLGVVLGEVLKGVQGTEPDEGLLVAELLHGLGVAVGDLALAGERELLLVVRGGLRDLAAGLPNPLVSHAGADGGSGQDHQGA
jgi:hypothetical protein